MNRLVIIGNGFDLAHGLPTSYKDFIDDYWSNIKDSNHNELVFFEFGKYVAFDGHVNFESLIKSVLTVDNNYKRDGVEVYKFADFPKPMIDNRIQILNYKNHFFKLINNSSNHNWVDIENIYYKNLKERAKGELEGQNYLWSVEKLNEEFKQVKDLFEKYLQEKVIPKCIIENKDCFGIHNIIKPISYTSNENRIFEEFANNEDRNEVKAKFTKEKNEFIRNKLYFLSFNYTPTVKKYFEILDKERIEAKLNYIHGEISNEDNKINFGFGDEMDEDYKLIENIDDNEYLKNFKSFQYLQNNNYNDLLSYIDSDKFQVLIMGHSCGLSDRTLLNTIFGHKNCRSIKPFFHEYKDEDGKVIGDNYTDLVQNISRHFNDKKVMRSKLVNKELCKPLPQIQLTKKE